MAKQRHTGAFVAGSLLGGLLGAAVTIWKTPKSGAELRASLSGGGDDGTAPATTTTVASGERRFSSPVLSFVEKATAPIVGVKLGKLAKDDQEAAEATPVRVQAAGARPPGAATAGFSPREPEHGTAIATNDTPAPTRGEPVTDAPSSVPTGTTGGETVRYRTTREPADVKEVEEPPREESFENVARAPIAEERTAPTGGTTDRESDRSAVNPDEEATHDPEEGSEAHAATTEDLTQPTPEYLEHLEEDRQTEPVDDGSVDFPGPPRRDTTG